MGETLQPVRGHAFEADVRFDGGDLDCGGGLLLLIRRHIDPLPVGGLLEIISREPSVAEDLPSWCRLTGNQLVSWTRGEGGASFLVSKGPFDGRRRVESSPAVAELAAMPREPVAVPQALPRPAEAPPVAPLSVMGVGSWPRPVWMLRSIHDHLTGALAEDEFQSTADDAVRLCVQAQQRAGADVLTDGEQRRDGYASFVGGIVQNVQLIPLADLAAMVDHRDEFERELRALDVPATEVRHPVVFGPLGRSRPLATHELRFARTLTDGPVKVSLPGPYLLSRTMWLDCLRDNPYDSREALARDVVRVLREEVHDLLANGASIVQLDEPVLTEVVFSRPATRRSFMCGALSEKGDVGDELAFALRLLNEVCAGLPADRLALHVCRGNWTRLASALLAGDYRPLLGLLDAVQVGTLFLELSTPRAGELDVLADIDARKRIAVGVVNPRAERVESAGEITGRAAVAIATFGADRVLLCSDCGFATFADNPVASAAVAERKLAAMADAARRLRGGAHPTTDHDR